MRDTFRGTSTFSVVTTTAPTTTHAHLRVPHPANPTVELEKLANSHGNTYLTAPVFGRPDAAAAGTLIQLVSGDAKAKATVRPILEIWSKAVIDIGAEVYKGESDDLVSRAAMDRVRPRWNGPQRSARVRPISKHC